MNSKHIDLLNEVRSRLVRFANESGIDLRSEFKTVENFQKFVIAFTFKALTDAGLEVNEAFDLVMGAGEYDKLAEKTWNAAQA